MIYINFWIILVWLKDMFNIKNIQLAQNFYNNSQLS